MFAHFLNYIYLILYPCKGQGLLTYLTKNDIIKIIDEYRRNISESNGDGPWLEMPFEEAEEQEGGEKETGADNTHEEEEGKKEHQNKTMGKGLDPLVLESKPRKRPPNVLIVGTKKCGTGL